MYHWIDIAWFKKKKMDYTPFFLFFLDVCTFWWVAKYLVPHLEQQLTCLAPGSNI